MGSTRYKISVVWVLILFSTFQARSQTWSEWFSQKKTQQKYLIEQLSALKLYAGYLKKGYNIGKSGLGFIKSATSGEFDLHHAFFTSLKTVSPEVKKYPRIAEILLMQLQVGRVFSKIRLSDNMPTHLAYTEEVESEILKQCANDLEELLTVVTSGKMEMKEEERLIRIDRIYESMVSKRSFTLEFDKAVRSVITQRLLHQNDLKKIGGLHGN